MRDKSFSVRLREEQEEALYSSHLVVLKFYSTHRPPPLLLITLIIIRDLLDDIPLTGWDGVRDVHSEVLRSVEQGRLVWTDVSACTKAITKALRRAHLAMLAKSEDKGKGKDKGGKSKSAVAKVEKRPCVEYQTQNCDFTATHTTDGVIWMHCCATCLRTRHQCYSHPKAICNRQKSLEEKGVPKN